MLKHSGSTIDQLKIFVKRGNFSPMKNKMPHNRRARWQNNKYFYFTSPQPTTPREASDSDFTIEDVMLWPVCASPCALNVSAALQDAYITPFPTEVVPAIRAQRDKAYVSKIVCYLHVMASYATCTSTHILHHDLPRISTIFVLLRLNPLSQRKLPIVISLSRMLCFGRYALLLALSM